LRFYKDSFISSIDFRRWIVEGYHPVATARGSALPFIETIFLIDVDDRRKTQSQICPISAALSASKRPLISSLELNVEPQ
jgi:hypothetical protein